jgi:hypothetical protein
MSLQTTNETKKWTREMKTIFDEGRIVAFLPDDAEETDARTIQYAPELKQAAEEFCDEVDSGSLKVKKAYNTFKLLIAKMTA